MKFNINKVIVINFLITIFLFCNQLLAKNIKNTFYVLAAPKVCTACLNAYGDLLMNVDNRMDLIFVVNEKEPFSNLQLKQRIKNLYLINRSFDVIQDDSLYNYLFNKTKIEKIKLEKVPLLFYGDGLKTIKFICKVDNIPQKIEQINSLYKETINIEQFKLNIDDEIKNSCPNCFMNIVNDTFTIGNNYLNKLNKIALNKINQSNFILEKNDLLSNEEYLQIYRVANNNDTFGFSDFRKIPLSPLMTINCLNVNNINYISTLYYTVKIDSNKISPGGVKYGLIKTSKDSIKLVPIIYNDSEKALQLYSIADLNNDTLLFIMTNHNGFPSNGSPFLAKFKKYNEDSIVFVEYLNEIKYINNSKFHSMLLPIFRNEWFISFFNDKIYNLKDNRIISFKINEMINFFATKSNYKISPKDIKWIDLVETKNHFKIIFNDSKKIFTIYLSKINGKILNGNNYSFFNDKNLYSSYFFVYKNSYYYYSLESILTKLNFK